MGIVKFNDFNKRILDLHGWGSDPKSEFHPWLKSELLKFGYIVDCPKLPNTDNPVVEEQVQYLLKNYNREYNIIIGHSLGGCVSMKLIPHLNYSIDKLILIASCIKIPLGQFPEDDEIVSKICDWNFDFPKIKSKCKNIIVSRPSIDTLITKSQSQELSQALGQKLQYFKSNEDHACGEKEPNILKYIVT